MHMHKYFEEGRDYFITYVPADDADWYPFEETTFTCAFRHTWVLVSRRRPDDISFLRCPMPRGGECEAERNAVLNVMYYHCFTLNADWNSEDVPCSGELCAVENPWHGNMVR